jgi:transcriptional regulator with XRE-family HTH domain
LSLAELAGQARPAQQALSNLAQVAGNPMVDTLFSVAVVLGVPVTRMVAELSVANPSPRPATSERIPAMTQLAGCLCRIGGGHSRTRPGRRLDRALPARPR